MKPSEQMKPPDITEKVWLVAQEASYVLITSVLWLVCSLPVVTIGASTTAAYALLVDHAADGNREMARPFFTAFKLKFVRATAVWGVLALCLAVLGFDIYYYLWVRAASVSSVLMAASQVLLLGCVIAVATYVFAETINSEGSVWRVIRDAARLAWRHWLASIVIVAVTIAVPALLVWLKLWQFAVFALGIVAYANIRILVRAAQRP